jgi:putative spermidine/putrescine transport system permease protein
MNRKQQIITYLQVAPLALVLLLFVVVPLVLVVIVSFYRYSVMTGMVPDFSFDNYLHLLTSASTWGLYLSTLKFAVITLIITGFLGFWLAYFLVFHVRNILIAIALFLICTVPFWTSNIIRMISWRPVLGREGLINTALLDAGIVNRPIDWLLFSDFSVVVAYVHLYTLFMIVPIFNSMARIDPSLLEAAIDGGARPWQVLWEVVLPLSKTGIALGSIFVIALVMGDFFVVRVMSGGQSATVASAMVNEIALLQYPSAAAGAVMLLIIVTLMVSAILRIVDVRRELAQ